MALPAVDGGEIDLATLRGQVVVIHVFTTWSLAAQAEVEQIRAADQRNDVAVVGLALDPEGRLMVAPWRNANRVEYLLALGDDRVRSGDSPLGQLSTVPATIILDRAGRIRERATRQLTPTELTTLIDAVRSAP